jgi:hypothetical protein
MGTGFIGTEGHAATLQTAASCGVVRKITEWIWIKLH